MFSAVAEAEISRGLISMVDGLIALFGVPTTDVGIIIGVDRMRDMLASPQPRGSDIVNAAVVDL